MNTQGQKKQQAQSLLIEDYEIVPLIELAKVDALFNFSFFPPPIKSDVTSIVDPSIIIDDDEEQESVVAMGTVVVVVVEVLLGN